MTDKVCILLATYNGASYLAEQLESIASQEYLLWHLFAADDGSCDQTSSILMDFALRLGRERVFLRQGPGRGATVNFLNLACAVPDGYTAYAFCDQDDVWERDKLGRALARLTSLPTDVPALYCSRVQLIDETGRSLGFSRLPLHPPSFGHALVQNIANGNTMVFNAAARSMLVQAGADVTVPVHDWWLYLIVTACGGVVYYDPVASVRYRQHPGNLIGSGVGVTARMHRFIRFLNGQQAAWFRDLCQALERIKPWMPAAQRAQLDAFNQARTAPKPWQRLAELQRAGVYRQDTWGNASLWLGALLGLL